MYNADSKHTLLSVFNLVPKAPGRLRAAEERPSSQRRYPSKQA